MPSAVSVTFITLGSIRQMWPCTAVRLQQGECIKAGKATNIAFQIIVCDINIVDNCIAMTINIAK